MTQQRDIGAELLQSVEDYKAGKGKKYIVDVSEEIKDIRDRLELSQKDFAELLNISLRTLQEWEQGRKSPKGPALSLLNIAIKHPEIFIEMRNQNP